MNEMKLFGESGNWSWMNIYLAFEAFFTADINLHYWFYISSSHPYVNMARSMNDAYSMELNHTELYKPSFSDADRFKPVFFLISWSKLSVSNSPTWKILSWINLGYHFKCISYCINNTIWSAPFEIDHFPILWLSIFDKKWHSYHFDNMWGEIHYIYYFHPKSLGSRISRAMTSKCI